MRAFSIGSRVAMHCARQRACPARDRCVRRATAPPASVGLLMLVRSGRGADRDRAHTALMQLKHDNKVSVARKLHRREANSWSLTLGVGTVALAIIAAVFGTVV